MKLLKLFSHCSLEFPPKSFDSLFDTVLGQDGLICDCVGWWSEFNKVGDGVDYINIGLGNITEGAETISQVVPSHRVPIGSFIIVVDGGRIP